MFCNVLHKWALGIFTFGGNRVKVTHIKWRLWNWYTPECNIDALRINDEMLKYRMSLDWCNPKTTFSLSVEFVSGIVPDLALLIPRMRRFADPSFVTYISVSLSRFRLQPWKAFFHSLGNIRQSLGGGIHLPRNHSEIETLDIPSPRLLWRFITPTSIRSSGIFGSYPWTRSGHKTSVAFTEPFSARPSWCLQVHLILLIGRTKPLLSILLCWNGMPEQGSGWTCHYAACLVVHLPVSHKSWSSPTSLPNTWMSFCFIKDHQNLTMVILPQNTHFFLTLSTHLSPIPYTG